MSAVVEVAGVRRRFGAVQALDGVDLVAEHGQVLALLGPNGAGKTTLVRMLATLLVPDEGTVRVAGIDAAVEPERVRQVIGLAGQHAAVEPAMTGRENLDMVARLFGLSRHEARAATDEVIDRLNLSEVASRRVCTYSGGMRRRLDLGASLVGRPLLLLLDEPTTGLDPRSRRALWRAISDLVTSGTDVLLTTQYLEEADALADRIVILDHGRVVADGTPEQLKTQAGQDIVIVGTGDDADLATVRRAVSRLDGREPVLDRDALTISWSSPAGAEELARVIGELAGTPVRLTEVTVRRPTMDEVFLRVTGGPSVDSSAGPAEAMKGSQS